MAESYDITTTIKVVKNSDKSTIVEESAYFNSLTFGLMVEKAADYYALVIKLSKK